MTTSTSTPIRDAVAAAAEARGLTQSRLAELAGVDQSLMSRWLAGKRRLHSDAAERLIVALGLAVK